MTTDIDTVTFKRVSNGQFETYLNGVKSKYEIVNGCLGFLGRGNNMYGIVDLETNKTLWLGTLQKCKKSISFSLKGK